MLKNEKKISEKRIQDWVKLGALITPQEFGKECKDFEDGCPVCEAYRALRVLQRLYKPL